MQFTYLLDLYINSKFYTVGFLVHSVGVPAAVPPQSFVYWPAACGGAHAVHVVLPVAEAYVNPEQSKQAEYPYVGVYDPLAHCEQDRISWKYPLSHFQLQLFEFCVEPLVYTELLGPFVQFKQIMSMVVPHTD